MAKFNVGDTVFSIKTGRGVVESDKTGIGLYPIIAMKCCYDLNGKSFDDHAYPSLFTMEEAKHHNFPEPPKQEPKFIEKMRYKAVFGDLQNGCHYINDMVFTSKEDAINAEHSMGYAEVKVMVKV